LPTREYFIYILASRSRTLYVGVTNDIERRLTEHRLGLSGFTGRYRVHRLVFLEAAPDADSAIAREKQLKGWTRAKKIALVESSNPAWDDLAQGWGVQIPRLHSG
jgi:putative endonuclease